MKWPRRADSTCPVSPCSRWPIILKFGCINHTLLFIIGVWKFLYQFVWNLPDISPEDASRISFSWTAGWICLNFRTIIAEAYLTDLQKVPPPECRNFRKFSGIVLLELVSLELLAQSFWYFEQLLFNIVWRTSASFQTEKFQEILRNLNFSRIFRKFRININIYPLISLLWFIITVKSLPDCGIHPLSLFLFQSRSILLHMIQTTYTIVKIVPR